MRLQPNAGWEITGVTVDNNNVTETYFANGHYDFDDDNDHTVSVAFGVINTITLNADKSLLSYYSFGTDDTEYDPYSETAQQIQWQVPAGSTYYLEFSPKTPLAYISSIMSGNDDLMPEYEKNGRITFENNTVDREVTVGIAKNTKKITVDRSNFYDQENNRNKAETIFSCISKIYEKDWTGGFEGDYPYDYRFGDGQEGSVTSDPDGIAITVGSKTGELWQPDILIVPYESFNLERKGHYGVIITAKFPCNGTLQIMLGHKYGRTEVKATGDFQEIVFEFPNELPYSSAAIGFVVFHCGDFLGTTIVKKIQIIDLDAAPIGNFGESDLYTSYDEENKFYVDKSVRMRLQPYAGWEITGVTVDNTNVTETYLANGYYDFDDYNDHTVSVAFGESMTTYSIGVGFAGDDVTAETTTTYFETPTRGRWYSTGDRFLKGEDVTLYIKTAIGYEVTSVSVNGNEVNVDEFLTYDNETKEYYHVFPNLKNYYGVEITTRKKVHDTSQTVHYRLNKAKGGTLCSEYDLDFSGFDKNKLSAYVASGYDPVTGLIALTRVWYVPAGTGLMLKGVVGDYEIPVTNTQFYYSNMFKGIVVKTFVDKYETDDDGTTYKNYVLRDGLFYELDGDENSKLDAYKAYLRIPAQYVPENTNQARRTIGVVFNDDDTTYINDIQTDNAEDGDYYNLNGQKVQTPQKGIYIKNGKKVIIR